MDVWLGEEDGDQGPGACVMKLLNDHWQSFRAGAAFDFPFRRGLTVGDVIGIVRGTYRELRGLPEQMRADLSSFNFVPIQPPIREMELWDGCRDWLYVELPPILVSLGEPTRPGC